jgi:hypothetical protein
MGPVWVVSYIQSVQYSISAYRVRFVMLVPPRPGRRRTQHMLTGRRWDISRLIVVEMATRVSQQIMN